MLVKDMFSVRLRGHRVELICNKEGQGSYYMFPSARITDGDYMFIYSDSDEAARCWRLFSENSVIRRYTASTFHEQFSQVFGVVYTMQDGLLRLPSGCRMNVMSS